MDWLGNSTGYHEFPPKKNDKSMPMTDPYGAGSYKNLQNWAIFIWGFYVGANIPAPWVLWDGLGKN